MFFAESWHRLHLLKILGLVTCRTEVHYSPFTSSATNESLLSENVQSYQSDTIITSVVYRTYLEMFCDIKPIFLELLKAHVSDGRHIDFHFSNEKVLSSETINILGAIFMHSKTENP